MILLRMLVYLVKEMAKAFLAPVKNHKNDVIYEWPLLRENHAVFG